MNHFVSTENMPLIIIFIQVGCGYLLDGPPVGNRGGGVLYLVLILNGITLVTHNYTNMKDMN